MIANSRAAAAQPDHVDLVLPLGLMLLAIAMSPWIGSLDVAVARHFYDADARAWLVPSGRPPIWFALYRAPKAFLIVFAICLVVAFCCSFRVPRLKPYRGGIVVMLIAMALIPSLVSYLKHTTHMYCPYQSTLFGGKVPDSGLFALHVRPLPGVKPGRCWPAGHASGGFAMLALMVFAERQRGRLRLLLALPGLALGWTMGLFQMARGHHYLSHTLASLGIALIAAAALEQVLRAWERRPGRARRFD